MSPPVVHMDVEKQIVKVYDQKQNGVRDPDPDSIEPPSEVHDIIPHIIKASHIIPVILVIRKV